MWQDVIINGFRFRSSCDVSVILVKVELVLNVSTYALVNIPNMNLYTNPCNYP